MLILVIDDHPDSRRMVLRAVPPEWQVLQAETAREGLHIAKSHIDALDAILLDIHLPDIDGRTLSLLLKQLRADLPIIPFTGFPAEAVGLEFLGCSPVLEKPTSKRRIVRAIQNAIDDVPPILRHPVVEILKWHAEQLYEKELEIAYGKKTIPASENKDDIKKAIVNLIEENGPMRMQEILLKIQWMGRRTLQRFLSDMVDSGILDASGTTNKRIYNVGDANAGFRLNRGYEDSQKNNSSPE